MRMTPSRIATDTSITDTRCGWSYPGASVATARATAGPPRVNVVETATEMRAEAAEAEEDLSMAAAGEAFRVERLQSALTDLRIELLSQVRPLRLVE